MGLAEAVKNLNKKALYMINGLTFEVILTDVTQQWGHIRYQISPVSGTGKIWVNEDTVELIELK